LTTFFYFAKITTTRLMNFEHSYFLYPYLIFARKMLALHHVELDKILKKIDHLGHDVIEGSI